MTLKRVTAACAVALTMLMRVSAQTQVGKGDDPEVLLQAAMHKEQVEGRLSEAIAAYKETVAKASTRTDVAAKATLGLARTYEKLGQPAARDTYQSILRDYPDQTAIVAMARAKLRTAPGGVQPSALTPRVVSTGSFMPRGISRDGRLAAGRDLVSGDFVLKDLQTGETKRLLSGGAIAVDPSFSPDGTRVVFNWMDVRPEQGGVASLRVVSTGGAANLRTLFTLDQNGAVLIPLGWLPDARTVIAAVKSESSQSLIKVDVESGVRSLIRTGPGVRAFGALSPDGRYIAYVLAPDTSGPTRILLQDVITGEDSELVSGAGRNYSPLWMPDGSHILFTSDRSGSWGLYAVGVRDGRPTANPIPLRTGFDVRPLGVSLSGDFYYHQQAQQPAQYVYVAERGIPGARAVQAFNGEGVSWSPDGAALAFLKNEGGGFDHVNLMTRNIATGEEHLYAKPGGLGLQQVHWARDGSGIVVNVTPDNDKEKGLGGIYFFDLKTKEYKALALRQFKAQSGGMAELSPDLKTLYLMMRPKEGQGPALGAIDLATGTQKVLYELPPAENQATGLALSPDGATAALQTWVQPGSGTNLGRARLTLVNTDGSGARVLYGPYSTPTVWSNFAWTPDSQSILFIESNQRGVWRLMRIAAKGGDAVFDGLESATAITDKSVPPMQGGVLSLTVSPDGSRVAFGSYILPTQEVWMIENLTSFLQSSR